MKTPLSYYGGKQRLIPYILPLIPPHVQFCEVFCGGAAVTFSKNPSDNECINDVDGRLTNFYWQMKTNFSELQTLIQATMHSEINYQNAAKVLEDENESQVKRAWAYWVRTQMAFSFILNGGFAFGETGSGGNTANKRDNFTTKYEERMRKIEVFNRDAVELIKLKDNSENTVFFCDPPYVSSDQGGYKGYTKEHFISLLETLKNIKGKFILTSYPEPELMEYREKCGWRSKDIKQIVSVTGKRKETKYKTECITFNFNPPNAQVGLFDESPQTQEEIVCEEDAIQEIESAPEEGESVMERAERLFKEGKDVNAGSE